MEYKKETDYYENDMRHTADAPKLEKRLRKSLNVFGLVLLVLAVYLFGSFLLCSCYYRYVVVDNNAVLVDVVNELKSVRNSIDEVGLSLRNGMVTADLNNDRVVGENDGEPFRFGAIAPVIVDVAAVAVLVRLLFVFHNVQHLAMPNAPVANNDG
ncbi:hypothetical protein AGMMS49573_10970 [Endomicrobiia bacterium]|nr:hypothetical protein AGMMS49573_10970 [Endomicrobiia bacterium]